ncbi:hypothetical protein CCB80_04415 [Armatimonadetes bacterium Uphvl-Ar1]|nr:hypothetical protein CCB80_04415 [Armatimonadetes bacterium Uphvl-Ar1]
MGWFYPLALVSGLGKSFLGAGEGFVATSDAVDDIEDAEDDGGGDGEFEDEADEADGESADEFDAEDEADDDEEGDSDEFEGAGVFHFGCLLIVETVEAGGGLRGIRPELLWWISRSLC